jgi:hypothetical protein
MVRVRRGVTPEELRQIVTTLPEVRLRDHGTWVGIGVRGKGFGYLSEDEESVLLKAHRSEQEALVAQDPETFEPSWQAGQYAWVRIRLATVERDELVELATEAWCQTAPRKLVADNAEALSLPPGAVPGSDPVDHHEVPLPAR